MNAPISSAGQPENLTAYDLYLQGRALWELHRQEDNDKAVELFKKALEQDPKFGLAYVGLADAYIDKVKRFHGESFWLDSAIDLCRQAIALDANQLRAYTVLANAFSLKGWFDQMDAPVRKALELAPNDWDANRMAAAESTEFRRQEDMYSSIRNCFVTNPFDSWAPYELASELLFPFAGRFHRLRIKGPATEAIGTGVTGGAISDSDGERAAGIAFIALLDLL
jgi:tetratricopeptide (TPR) repeat protein